MNTPRVTVIIPVYNGERYIAEAIKSVLAQSEPCLLIVVDDGSTDGSGSIADDFEVIEGTDRIITLLSPENKGAAWALNAGILQADTEFVAWLSHDDVFMPTKIERQLEAIGDANACYTDFDIIDANGALVEHVRVKPPPPEGMFRQICVRNIINGSSMLLRRDVFERVGFFREDLRVDVDGERWLRMIGAGMRFVHVAEPLLKYRRHGAQLSSDKRLMRAVKDAVRCLAIEQTPPERAFPGIADPSIEYRFLARAMSAQGLTLAAAAARHKCLDLLESTV